MRRSPSSLPCFVVASPQLFFPTFLFFFFFFCVCPFCRGFHVGSALPRGLPLVPNVWYPMGNAAEGQESSWPSPKKGLPPSTAGTFAKPLSAIPSPKIPRRLRNSSTPPDNHLYYSRLAFQSSKPAPPESVTLLNAFLFSIAHYSPSAVTSLVLSSCRSHFHASPLSSVLAPQSATDRVPRASLPNGETPFLSHHIATAPTHTIYHHKAVATFSSWTHPSSTSSKAEPLSLLDFKALQSNVDPLPLSIPNFSRLSCLSSNPRSVFGCLKLEW